MEVLLTARIETISSDMAKADPDHDGARVSIRVVLRVRQTHPFKMNFSYVIAKKA